jgi:hypothetical protein
VLGEIWEVDKETLANLNQYEGVSKGHYERVTIQVKRRGGDDRRFQAYVYRARYDRVSASASPDGETRFHKERCGREQCCAQHMPQEYTLQYHERHYNPIRHIQVKQSLYFKEINGAGLQWDPTSSS